MAKNEILSKKKKKKESEDILNKRLLNQLKNGKIKVKCPICKNETLCYLCKFS
jgi:transposase-like protein